LSAGKHLEGDAAEAQTNPDMDVARILALAGPPRGQILKVVVTEDQVVGNAKKGSAERAVAVAHQGAGVVDLAGLVTRRTQAGATGECSNATRTILGKQEWRTLRVVLVWER